MALQDGEYLEQWRAQDQDGSLHDDTSNAQSHPETTPSRQQSTASIQQSPRDGLLKPNLWSSYMPVDSTTSEERLSQAPSQDQKRQLRWRNVWIWEFLVTFLSLGCMCAIGIILATMHGRPLARWPLPISPNALISVFATVSKSAMLLALAEGISQLKWVYFQRSAHRLKDFQIFDDASRGPWGAVKLIAKLNIRAIVAAAGALIVIMSLAMDPFVQQILTFRTDMVVAINGTATIGVATAFDSGASKRQSVGTYGQSSVTLASSDLTNSLVRGIFASDSNTAYSCPTGNCTWPDFDTLGVCSTCRSTTAKDACNTSDCLYKSYAPDPYGSKEVLYAAAVSGFSCATSNFATIAIVHREDNATSWQDEPAYSCALSFCRRSHTNTTFSTGTLSDITATSEPLVPHLGVKPRPANATSLCPFHTEADAKRNTTDSTTYWVNGNDIGVVGEALAPLFWTSLLTSLGANNYVASALYRHNGGNIPMTMDAVATSMTNQIRQGPNATQVRGTALIPEVYIHVSWLWLILPTTLVLLATIFLAVTMGFSAGKQQVVWKSSTLAMLFHSMHGLHSKEAGLNSVRSMRDAAEERCALLHQDEDGRVAMVYSDDNVAQEAALKR